MQRGSLFEHVVFSPVVCGRISRILLIFSREVAFRSRVSLLVIFERSWARGRISRIFQVKGAFGSLSHLSKVWFYSIRRYFQRSLARGIISHMFYVKVHPDFELDLQSFTLLQSLIFLLKKKNATDNHGNPANQLSCAPQATNGCRSRECAWWKTNSPRAQSPEKSTNVRNVNVSERMDTFLMKQI